MALEPYDDIVRRAVRAQRAGDLDVAEALYRAAFGNEPQRPEAVHYLGLLLGERGAFADAVAYLERSLALAPERAAFHYNSGTVLEKAGREQEAAAAFSRAIALRPGYALALGRLGQLHYRRGQFAKAERCFAALAAVEPSDVGTWRELAKCMIQQGRYADAELPCRRIVALEPNAGNGHQALALCLLLQGELGEGFDEAEWRWQATDFGLAPRPFPQPAWTGVPHPAGSLLLWGEQGVGDEILLASVVEEAAERVGRCLLECDPRLVPLFARSFPAIEVLPRAQPPRPRTLAADIAAQISTLSLPRLFRRRLADFPQRPAYLRADRRRADEFRQRYRALGTGPLIGVAWRSGNRTYGAARTVPLIDWAPMLRQPGVTFIDLQYGDNAAELASIRESFGVGVHHDSTIDQMADLDGFAAQLMAMDLVIAIDNSTVHLAGALGQAAWVMLPQGAGLYWCWLLDRDDSPWYPSLRLFRQPAPGAWGPVVARVAAELRAWRDRRGGC